MGQAEKRVKDLLHLLNHFDPQDPADPVLLCTFMEELERAALVPLGDRLLRPSTPPELKRLIYQSPTLFPWPEWTPILTRGLMVEQDLSLFEDGLRSLSLLRGEAQTDALRLIAQQRMEPGFQAVLQRKLEWLEGRQSVAYHLRDLTLGSQKSRLAQKAAEYLAPMVRPQDLPLLIEAAALEDFLAVRLALRTIGFIRSPEAASFLILHFQTSLAEIRQGRQAKAIMDGLRRKTPREQAVLLLAALRAELGEAEARLLPILAVVPAEGEGPVDLGPLMALDLPPFPARLRSSLEVVLSDRPARLSGILGEFVLSYVKRGGILGGIIDECAQALLQQCSGGQVQDEPLRELLREAFQEGAGNHGLPWIYANFLPSSLGEDLPIILACRDHEWREIVLRAFGEREDPLLAPYLQQMAEDAIVEVAQQALRYLGRLPGSQAIALEWLASGQPEAVRRAFNFFELNERASAAEPIHAYLESGPREELWLEAVATLGKLGNPNSVSILLEQLHSGQPSRCRRALVESLSCFSTPEAASALIARTAELRQPDLQLLALSALSRAHPAFQDPIPVSLLPAIEAALEAGLAEGGPLRHQAIAALEGLWVQEPTFYERMQGRIGEFIAAQNQRSTWDAEQKQAAQGAFRETGRRQGHLEDLTQKASRAQAFAERFLENPAQGQTPLSEFLAEGNRDPELWGNSSYREQVSRLIQTGLGAAGVGLEALECLGTLAVRLQEPGLAPVLLALIPRCGAESRLRRLAEMALKGLDLAPPPPPPLHSLLLLEPNGFFRRRVSGILQQRGFEVLEAEGREEAGRLLEIAAVELILAETEDHGGPLSHWFLDQWEQHHCRGVFLVCSDREASRAREEPWFAGLMLKPFSPEDLAAALGV